MNPSSLALDDIAIAIAIAIANRYYVVLSTFPS